MAQWSAGVGSNYNTYTLYLNATENTNAGGNYSTVSWSLVLVKSGGGYSYSLDATSYWYVYIGGYAYDGYLGYDFRNTSSITLASGTTGAIGHNADGSKAISVRGYFSGAGGSPLADGDTGWPTWGLTDFVRTPAAPGAPSLSRGGDGTSVTITSQVADQVGTAITDYNWRWSTDNSSWSGAVGMGTGRVSYHTGLSSTQDYYYQTRAYNSDGWGGWSGSSFIEGVPTVPRSVTGTASSDTQGRITVSWTSPADTNGGITSYDVYYADGTYIGNAGTATSYNVNSLTVGTTYSFKVRANNSSGYSAFSDSTAGVIAPGVPNAPTNVVVTPATDAVGKVTLTWDAPTIAVGGVSTYYIYVDGVLNTSSATSPGVVTGLNARQSYSFTVRARNPFAIANSTYGAASTAVTAVAPGPPTPPLNLAGAPDDLIAGKLNFTWQTPANTAGGITGYTLYYSSSNTVAATFTGTGTAGSVTGLIPGVTYGFYLKARNAVADASGTFSDKSTTISVGALGDPEAPFNVVLAPSPTAINRLILSWDEPIGAPNGYTITTPGGVVIDHVTSRSYAFDNCTPGVLYSYKVRATNSVTDAAGSPGGPFSVVASSTTGTSVAQTVSSIAVENSTNKLFDGSITLVATTATSMTFVKNAANVSFASIPAGSASCVNVTNQTLNGTYTIGVPAPTQLTFTKTIPDIPANTAVSNGQLLNNTDVIFNGTHTVTDVNSSAKTVSYTRTSDNVSSRAASGTVSNTTNAVFNGVYELSSVAATTLVYDTGGSDTIPVSTASGTATNVTNKSLFNGSFAVTDVPTYKTVTYANPLDSNATNLVPNPTMEGAGADVTVRTNLITNPNFEGDTTGWSATGATVTKNTSEKVVGGASMSVACTANGNLVKTTTKIAVSASTTYTLSAFVKAAAGKTLDIKLKEYSSSDVLGQTVLTSVTGDGAWQRVDVEITTSSTGVKLEPVFENTTAGANTFYVDAVLLENSHLVGTYFDGSTNDSLDFTYSWTGTDNASTSIQTGVGIAGYSGSSGAIVIQSAEWSATGTGE